MLRESRAQHQALDTGIGCPSQEDKCSKRFQPVVSDSLHTEKPGKLTPEGGKDLPEVTLESEQSGTDPRAAQL